jgi:hypothetical protein
MMIFILGTFADNTFRLGAGSTNDQDKYETLLLERNEASSATEFDPVTVSFWPTLIDVEIFDGAAALGYLFSVLQVPEGIIPSWDN